MSWDDKVKEWQKSEVTKALVCNFKEALDHLNDKLIYATAEDFQINQGLARAYLDMLDVVEHGNLVNPEEREDA